MPIRNMSAPTVLVIANSSAPSTLARASTRKPDSAYALTPISSKKTNAVNRSPARQKPTMPARNVMTSAWKRCPAVSIWCQATTIATAASAAANAARPAAMGST